MKKNYIEMQIKIAQYKEEDIITSSTTDAGDEIFSDFFGEE